MLVAVCELERMTVEQEEGVVESKIAKVTKVMILEGITSKFTSSDKFDLKFDQHTERCIHLEMWIITPSLHCVTYGLKLALLSDQR